MKTYQLALTGTTPLVMHNVRLADKLDPITKAIAAITGKRKKTDADEEEIGNLEFAGGLYTDEELGVYLPTFNVLRCFEEAAKVTRMGKTVTRAVVVESDKAKLRYSGPQDWRKLRDDPTYRWRASVGVGTKPVSRVRPIFRQWALDVRVRLLEEVLNPDEFLGIVQQAGVIEGLGDARRLGNGRFTVEAKEVQDN
jgi:hypothetical protein